MGRTNAHCEQAAGAPALSRAKASGALALRRVKASGTQSIERASQLIRLIASHNVSGLPIGEITALGTLDRTTVHRILKCLMSEGLAMRSPETGRYFLGPLAFELGLAAAPKFNLAHICSGGLHRIAEKSGDTVFLMVRSGYDSVCLDRVEGSFPIKTATTNVGARRPLGIGAGSLAMMMRLADEAIEEILSANADRLATQYAVGAPYVWKALKRSRELGYGLNEYQKRIGIMTLSLPIANRFGHAFAAISIGAISTRMNPARQKELVAILRAEIPLIEKALGEMKQA